MKNIPLYQVRPIKDLKDMLNSSVALYGDRTAFLMKPKSGDPYVPITYNQYKKDVDAFGTALANIGLKGKTIALIGENRYEWSISYLAVLNGLGTIVPLDKELPQNEVKNLLIRSKANAVIFSDNNKDLLAGISDQLSSVDFYIDMGSSEDSGKVLSFKNLLKKGHELLDGGDRSFVDSQVDPEAPSILLFTSGTTDTSKAVMLSHRNICTNLMAMCSMTYIDENDVFLSILPIHHTYECTCGFLCPLYRGATVAYCEGLRHILKNLQESKATVMLGVPLIFEAIYRRIWEQAAKSGMDKKLKIGLALSNALRKFGVDIRKKLFAKVHESFGGNIKLFISGAAAIDPSISKGFRDLGIDFIQGYGLTECSPIVALNRDVDYKDDAAGLPLPNTEVKIDNPSADGIGEIVVKGPGVMLGYYENQEETEAVLKDGWFYTGDLGYIDQEGFVHITGRKKNVIITKNGKNVYPEELEALLDKTPYIKESLVYSKPDESSDDIIISAMIVPDIDKIQEDFKDKSLSDEEIKELIRNDIKKINKEMVIYKHIRDFIIRKEEFAKTTTRKIKRYVETNK